MAVKIARRYSCQNWRPNYFKPLQKLYFSGPHKSILPWRFYNLLIKIFNKTLKFYLYGRCLVLQERAESRHMVMSNTSRNILSNCIDILWNCHDFQNNINYQKVIHGESKSTIGFSSACSEGPSQVKLKIAQILKVCIRQRSWVTQ